MAFAGLLALLDDIATVLDDVAVMTKVAARKGAAMSDDVAVLTKVAAQKSAGVLGDDLALNAQQVTGVASARELPVVWAVAKGSFINKAILVPLALLISAFAPKLVTPLLMIGGAFLCFEGAEKILHKFLPHGHAEQGHADAAQEAPLDEAAKIKGAVRTDFILSAEIMAIVLGVVDGKPFAQQAVVLVLLAVLMTIAVYGLVACIVKLDDLGLWLARQRDALRRGLGQAILWAAPWLMKTLSIVGMAAMFMVGGGILVHGAPALHHAVEHVSAQLTGNPANALINTLGNALVGVIAGVLIVAVVTGAQKLFRRTPKA
ncbi:DUF808 domain-containing protein [Allofranklinella schreckenbergeri]|uniref:DUF808 domain-containing protein n=1 Tax=Allofranklinella schreckenbergeri TaxID=1076744 RepID=A0A3M6Q7C6_9BURK|nr:DUF808 domain-containing protein [Allofranklinella schreckenbergeri]RMW98520.1 DUF808 domain-containing protein [Allofranklinella schreckenbergeri]